MFSKTKTLGSLGIIDLFLGTTRYMKNEILDNPVYNAMISFNSQLALGNDTVKYFPEDVGPFAGLKLFDDESFARLYKMLPANRTAAILTASHLKIPGNWKVKDTFKVLQMSGENIEPLPGSYHDIVPLGSQHVSQMIALTKLTHPGPFLQRTIEFGNYTGIFHGSELIAMAGQRLHPFQYVEISAVCTHPSYTGNGYAKSLIHLQINLIISKGGTPFLHVRADNESAISVYKHLGFSLRSEMNIYVIHK